MGEATATCRGVMLLQRRRPGRPLEDHAAAAWVYAIDRDGGRYHQMVGWRLIIDRSGDGMPATVIHKGRIEKAIAYDHQPVYGNCHGIVI